MENISILKKVIKERIAELKELLIYAKEKRARIVSELIHRAKKDDEFKRKYDEFGEKLKSITYIQIKELSFCLDDLKKANIKECSDEDLLHVLIVANALNTIISRDIENLIFLVNSYKNNRAVGYVDPKSLIYLFNYLWLYKKTDIKVLAQGLGEMFYLFTTVEGLKEEHLCQVGDDTYPYEVLSKYFNPDGTFAFFNREPFDPDEFQIYVDIFRMNLSSFTSESALSAMYFSKEENDQIKKLDFFKSALGDLCRQENLEYQKAQKEAKKNEKTSVTTPIVTLVAQPKEEKIKDKKEALEIIKRYYQNGFLVNIPDDVDLFREALNLTLISKEEKEYIEELLDLALKDNIVRYLDRENVAIYLESLKIKRDVPFTSDIYAQISSYQNSLASTIDLQKETTDAEDLTILREEQKEIIYELNMLIRTHFSNTENNLIYLIDTDGNPFVFKDLKQLNKKLSEIPHEMNEENMQFVSFVPGLDLATYKIDVENISLYVIEIALGIYVVVGATSLNVRAKQMQNRIFKYVSILNDYAQNMSNGKSRGNLLESAAKVLERTKEGEKNVPN